MKYKPWIGFSLIGLGIVADFILGRTGIIFITSMFAVTAWAQR